VQVRAEGKGQGRHRRGGGRWFFLKPETWNLKPKITASALGERSYRTAFRRRDAAGPRWKSEQPVFPDL